jgi:probable HAF family extracellular repeat protein
LNGKVTDLTTAATGFPNVSFGEAINDLGEVVGEYQDPGVPGGSFAFVCKPGQPLQILEGTQAIYPTFSINNLGLIALSLPLTPPLSVTNAAIYRNGVITYFGNLPGGNGSSANGINDRDQVVGGADVPAPNGGIYHAFLWQDGPRPFSSMSAERCTT